MSACRPILLNSCARAATAQEARYRIDREVASDRSVRVVALDAGAAAIVAAAARLPWHDTRFFTGAALMPTNEAGTGLDVSLRTAGGGLSRLSDQLDGAHVAVLVASTGGDGACAGAIGAACALRGVMTAGLVLGDPRDAEDTVSSLRPHAQVLLVTRDDHDLVDLLTALRA
jgi:hypothetical protein